jgi:competence protein ComEC
LSGDIERQIEAELVAEGLLRKTDVLKVPHHGSKTSSTAEFLDLLRPAFAVMSAGYENSYGHPHAEVLERYQERQACVLRTDLDGLVSVRSDGRRLRMGMGRWSGDLGSAAGALLPREF